MPFVLCRGCRHSEPPQMPLAAFDMLCAPAKQQIRSEARRKAGVTNPRAHPPHRVPPFGGFCFCCRKFGIRTPSKAEWLLTCFAPLQSNKSAAKPGAKRGVTNPRANPPHRASPFGISARGPSRRRPLPDGKRYVPTVGRRLSPAPSLLRRNTNEKSEGIPFGFFLVDHQGLEPWTGRL